MGRNVLVGICGGIAAYKVCEILSSLAKEGYSARAIATDSACRFITPLTLATLCRHAAYTDSDFWQPHYDRPPAYRSGGMGGRFSRGTAYGQHPGQARLGNRR